MYEIPANNDGDSRDDDAGEPDSHGGPEPTSHDDVTHSSNSTANGEVLELSEMLPGPGLGLILAGIDITAVSTHELVTVLTARARQKAFEEAQLVHVMAELTGRAEYQRCSCPPDVIHIHRAVEPAGDEISLALAWSPARGKHRAATALELTEDLTATLKALESGQIDMDKAALIADRTRCLPSPELRRKVEAIVLPIAGSKTRRQLDHLLRREVIAADPGGAEQRRTTATKNRRVTRPEPAGPGGDDGMACMELYGPADDLAALWVAVDAAARHARTNSDTRTMDQLRFDTLAGLGWTSLTLGHLGCCNPACAETSSAAGPRLGKRRGKAATVNVTVAASTLFGADEQPGWLDGFGPITAQTSRRISDEGPWRRLLTDPATRQVLEYGRTTYTPPAELAVHVIARDFTCRFPTCNRPAREADIDHIHPYEQGGTTGASNTWALHNGHHFGKTHHGYAIDADTDGTMWWITPAGHAYRVDPEAVGPLLQPEVTTSTEPPPF